ncbi:cytochrome c oxidase subunit II [Azospirillum soli]|uniref:cytochrome c oxidase subunit II n=1 Tax=Azospirillum soli TaxID=1304799 RepID=UPI001AEB58E7|nr:cytochrome c oxidase subunit II [Azospirillum soli]MBP2315800.1 cytochrome c oxidase subunit 2 [Azospirillum soli]
MAGTKRVWAALVVALITFASGAWAQQPGTATPPGQEPPATALPVLGEPHPWQIWHQTPASPVMQMMDWFHHLLVWIMVAICVLVLALIAIVVVRFNARKNPVPSRTSHNTLIEVVWTVVPVIILVVIAVPSFRLLYFGDHVREADMTLKITGRQWYWDYEYPDHGNFTFSSIMIPEDQIKPGQRRLLEVDNRVVLPVDTTVRLLVTAGDVIHSFGLPAFGLKEDGVPGRLHESWVKIEKEGVYYGQCSEICGTGHGYMPIAIEAVSKERFAQWVEQARKQFAGSDAVPPTEVATAPQP